MNTASITANSSPDSDNADDTSVPVQVAIAPNAMSTDVAAGDPDWQNQIDGVDVLFQKSSSGIYTLKATNPGTFKYRLSLTNETGVDVHVRGKQLPDIIRNGVAIKDANGGTTTVYLTVPSMPSSTGTPYPLSITDRALPAFLLSGYKPVRAHPDDRTDDMAITVWYLRESYGWTSGSSCSTVPESEYWLLPSNADNLPARCLRIDGLEIRKHHQAHIHVAYEFRWKDNPASVNWAASTVDPSQAFRAGFNFKSTTVIELDGPPSDVQARFAQQLNRLPVGVRPDYQAKFDALWDKDYTGSHALGLTFAGERMTAVGGFVFDPSGNGRANVTVRLFSAPPSVDRCGSYGYGTNNLVASYLTGSDGFYFIWQKNLDNTGLGTGTNSLAPGFKYYVALCDLTVGGTAMPFDKLYWPARSMQSTLGNKEFDEEDFFVSGPTRLTYTSQPISGRVGRTLGTVKVALLDGFGNVMTMDTGGGASSITLSLASGPAGGTLSPTTGLVKSLSAGVATWTNLVISAPAGVYKLNADSSVNGVPDETSLPINITP